jgi:hypothetical protein
MNNIMKPQRVHIQHVFITLQQLDENYNLFVEVIRSSYHIFLLGTSYNISYIEASSHVIKYKPLSSTRL